LLGGGLALVLVAVATGVVLALLNARDRRRDRVAALVACVCATPSLRGWIALRVRAPLFRRRTVVVLDMSACSPDLIWPTLRRVGAILPRETALAIQARVDGELRVAVTIAAQFV
jgi:hypothetical protein